MLGNWFWQCWGIECTCWGIGFANVWELNVHVGESVWQCRGIKSSGWGIVFGNVGELNVHVAELVLAQLGNSM